MVDMGRGIAWSWKEDLGVRSGWPGILVVLGVFSFFPYRHLELLDLIRDVLRGKTPLVSWGEV